MHVQRCSASVCLLLGCILFSEFQNGFGALGAVGISTSRFSLVSLLFRFLVLSLAVLSDVTVVSGPWSFLVRGGFVGWGLRLRLVVFFVCGRSSSLGSWSGSVQLVWGVGCLGDPPASAGVVCLVSSQILYLL